MPVLKIGIEIVVDNISDWIAFKFERENNIMGTVMAFSFKFMCLVCTVRRLVGAVVTLARYYKRVLRLEYPFVVF